MTVENFVRIVSTVFDKIEKSSQMAVPCSISASLEFQPYDVDLIAHIGPPQGVKWLEKVSFESLRQFLKKIEKVHNWLLFGQFRLFLESQLNDINVIAHIGPPYNV